MADLTLPSENADLASLRRYAFIGLIGVVGLFGGFTFWASRTELSGAVAAPGTVVVDGFAKRIQHQEGGIVRNFYVRDGDVVASGQLLAELDSTALAANLEALDTQVREATLREARMVAEINFLDDIEITSDLKPLVGDAEGQTLLATELQVLHSHKAGLNSRSSQLTEQVSQLERQIEGLSIQLDAVQRQREIADGEYSSLRELYAGQLVEANRVTSLERQIAEIDGERGRLIAAIAEAKAAISERRLQINQVEQDYLSNVLNELQETRRVLFEATQQRVAAADRLRRTAIRAPQAGVIHESSIHTVGGVVGAGETLMLIVPQDDKLLVSARIAPTDIDKVAIDQLVHIKLLGFSQRTTPEVTGNVTTIAPDLTQDQVSGQYYYSVRISISENELDSLPNNVKLVPGMPVEAFMRTVDRSVLDYLVQPLVDQLSYAFREE